MEFISESKVLNDRFAELCKQYVKFEWIVAWAGDIKSFDAGHLLSKYENKIRRLVVGLHFYQTHPNFIEYFIRNKSVRFIKQTDGVFHPKLYLFYNSSNDWTAIVGSANFTMSAFKSNVEANISITSEDCPESVFNQIRSFIQSQWNSASPFNFRELDEYEECWKKQRQLTHSLSRTRISDKQGEFASKIFDLKTWDEYEAEVIHSPSYASRKRMLKAAHLLFKQPFSTLSLVDRKRLSGCPTDRENQLSKKINESIDWKFFGSTKASRLFPSLIKANDKHIAKAIDRIPLDKEITKQMYDDYVQEFMKSMPGAKNPLAVVTRLLSIKRPDVFICVDGKNKGTLCKQYGLKRSQLNIYNYWDCLIERIMSSAWYDAPKTADLYPYRVAMLDCLHYEE